MSKWELPKEPKFYNYESPLSKIYGEIEQQIIKQEEDNCMMAITQAVGYTVNKDELIKALNYDREQYDKGYKDGVRETFNTEIEQMKEEIEKATTYIYFIGLPDGTKEPMVSMNEVFRIMNRYKKEKEE